MRLRHPILLALLLLSTTADAFELIMVQAVSDTRKTFVTRNGKRQGNVIGMTGTFTADDVSILAKAVNVTGQFTQWQVVNEGATLPFEKGAIVTYYPAAEYIWALAPESERKKYIKSQIAVPKRSWIVKGAFTRGISESVSEAPATKTTRGGFLGEIYYEKDFIYSFSWDVGLRYEREVSNYEGGSFLTKRSLLMADVNYYFDQLKDLIGGRLYVGAGLGYGLSNTTAVGLSQSGPVAILPAVKIGLDLPFNADWSFLIGSGFESMSAREEQEDGRKQTTTQTNFKVDIGLRHYF